MLHLNHFYKDPHALKSLKHPFMLNVTDNDIPREMNFLVYGYDTSLCKYYVYKMLCKNNEKITSYEHTINVLGTDIQYANCNQFLEFNLKTHLSKEKTAMVELIKNITSTRKPSNEKHVIVMLNIDAMNLQLQYRLRRIIEKSSDNASFVCVCNLLAKVIEPLQSRFSLMRTPILTKTEKQYMCTHIQNLLQSDKDTNGLIKCLKNMDSFQDVMSLVLSFYYVDNEQVLEDMSKSMKRFKFVENEIKVLFSSFVKSKSTITSINDIRDFVYKIIHYNIDHKIIIRYAIATLSSIKAYAPFMHQIVCIFKKFDMDMTSINQCKVVHAYEVCLASILNLLLN